MRNGLACGGVLAVVALAIAGCSDGEELDVSEPVGEASEVAATIMESPADVHPGGIAPAEATDDTAEAQIAVVPPVVMAEEPAPDLGEELRARLRERQRQAILDDQKLLESLERTPPPREVTATPTPPLPTVEFPDDIALLGLHHRIVPREGGEMFLQRVYWSGGELVRETIFSFSPVAGGGLNWGMVAASDASSFIHTYCIEPSCLMFTTGWDGISLGRFALNESRDGGVTWEPLVEFDEPDIAVKVLPGRNGNDRQAIIQPWSSPSILWPSGQTEPEAPPGYRLQPSKDWVVLADGRLAWAFKKDRPPAFVAEWQLYRYLTADGEDVTELVPPLTRACWWCLTLPDGRLLQGRTIIDPETGERFGKFDLPAAEMPRSEDAFQPLAIQHGPFLRVVDHLDGCLPVLADPSPDAEELACMAARVLLTDLAEAAEIEGATWHRVRTPAGIEGFADGRYLE